MTTTPARWLPLLALALALWLAPALSAAAPTNGPIDLNGATEAELTELPGIGPKKARAIVDERLRNGPFTSVDDLERVRGIGPATIDRLRPWASAGAVTKRAPPALPANTGDEKFDEPDEDPAPTPNRKHGGGGRPAAKATVVDVNTASADELCGLPGVEPSIARALIAARPLRGLPDLAKAGVPNAAKLGPRVRFQVDLNRATAAQLVALGVPADAAKKAIELRELAGGFASVQELASVPGIRPELVTALTGVLIARPR